MPLQVSRKNLQEQSSRIGFFIEIITNRQKSANSALSLGLTSLLSSNVLWAGHYQDMEVESLQTTVTAPVAEVANRARSISCTVEIVTLNLMIGDNKERIKLPILLVNKTITTIIIGNGYGRFSKRCIFNSVGTHLTFLTLASLMIYLR